MVPKLRVQILEFLIGDKFTVFGNKNHRTMRTIKNICSLLKQLLSCSLLKHHLCLDGRLSMLGFFFSYLLGAYNQKSLVTRENFGNP